MSLRLVFSREEPQDGPLAEPVRAVPAGERPAPREPASTDRAVVVALAASLLFHAAVITYAEWRDRNTEARSLGAGEDIILIEGIPVEMVFAEATPAVLLPEAAAEAEPVAVEAVAETAEPVPEEAPPEGIDAEAPARTETASEPLPEDEPPEPAESEPEPEAPAAPPVEATVTSPAEEEAPPPVEAAEAVPEEVPAPGEEAEVAAIAEADVPMPRARPERATRQAAAAPAERENPAPARPAPAKPAPAKPARPASAAPPPQAPSAARTGRAAGAGGGGTAETRGTASVASYQQSVAAKIRRNRFYPGEARRQRLAGTTVVAFAIDASGRAGGVRIVRSAGSRVLDNAAVAMVNRASPFGPLPRGVRSPMAIQVPIRFELPR